MAQYYYHHPHQRRRKNKNYTKTVLWVLLIIFLLFASVLIIRTFAYPFAKKEQGEVVALPYDLSEKSVKRLVGGIRIPTVSEHVSLSTNNPFDRFKAYLTEVFPGIYSTMDTLTVNKYGLLFRWKGKDSYRKPILLLAHYDVVPVAGYDPLTTNPSDDAVFRMNDPVKEPINSYQTDWTFPPFSGAVADGRIYGRGTLDDKGMLFSMLEAADALITEGFQPEQDIWFAFGFDEEIGGTEGAVKIAEYFNNQNITFDAVYDEGSIIIAPGQAGISQPLALIGVAEKGSCTIRITVRGLGGHSSMPPEKGSLVYAAEIIQKLNDEQMPLTLIPPVSSFLDQAGASMGFPVRLAIANKWLLEGVLLNTMSKNPATNALVRTTTAITMASGSDAPNVMASSAEITANFRILTGNTVQSVVDHVTEACKDYDVDIEILAAREPSSISMTDTHAYNMIRKLVPQLYPEATVTPYISIVATDAYKYESVSDNVYRFMPAYLNEYEQRTLHNENEYITLDNYAKMIAYFTELMRTYEVNND